jgi:crossover junction endodeoxyribonuclease RusA
LGSITGPRPPASEVQLWTESLPNGDLREHRVMVVGHACGWEERVWPEDADDQLLDHLIACPAGRAWRFLMTGDRPPLSLNDRGHWGARSRLTKSVREEAAWRARLSKIPRLKKCRVEVTWVVSDTRRRDEDNPAPSAKAVYDGLVDAGVVADDTPEYMEKPSVKIVKQTGERKWFVTVVDLSQEGSM